MPLARCPAAGWWTASGPATSIPAILILWSLATACLGIVGSFIGLFLIRLLIGALEAPSYMINNQVVTSWFPDRERGGAIGFYISGQFIGLAFLQPLLVWLVANARLAQRCFSPPASAGRCGAWCGF